MHAFTPFYSPMATGISDIFVPFIFVALVWTIVLKGYALWNAARGNQKKWFIAILIVNTLGILEIVYLIWFRPKTNTPSKEKEVAPVHTSSPQ